MGYYLKWGFIALFAALFAALLHYSLPQWDVVRINDTYEKRVNPGSNSLFWGRADSGEAAAGARDVFFIQAKAPNDSPIVYRNEDTGWGWPFVFKFDTANVQADAVDLKSSAEAPKWVAVKHYGWRNEYFSIYPNAISVKPVAGPDARVIPWMSIAILLVILMIIWAITSRIVLLFRNVLRPAAERAGDRMARLRGRFGR